jgi:hypothetical protein
MTLASARKSPPKSRKIDRLFIVWKEGIGNKGDRQSVTTRPEIFQQQNSWFRVQSPAVDLTSIHVNRWTNMARINIHIVQVTGPSCL